MVNRIFPLLIAAAGLAQAEISVTVGDVSDKRTTGKFFSGLEINLLLSGAELAEVKGLRLKVTSATDDTGKNLVDESKSKAFGDSFEPLKEPFGSGPKKKGEYEASVKLVNPARVAKTVKLVGTAELLSPKLDPASVITVSLAQSAGKPLDNPALKAAGVQIQLEAPKGNELAYKLKDPNHKLASLEFCNAEGKPLKTQGSTSWGMGGSKNISINIPNPPKDATVKIYLATGKSLLSVPFQLDAIKLP